MKRSAMVFSTIIEQIFLGQCLVTATAAVTITVTILDIVTDPAPDFVTTSVSQSYTIQSYTSLFFLILHISSYPRLSYLSGIHLDAHLGVHRKLASLTFSSFSNTDTSNLTVVTKSAPDAFPSALRSKRSVVKTSLKAGEASEGAIIKEKCPECGHDEMEYHTLQLRSADEGATVFYTCTKCHYKFRTNNQTEIFMEDVRYRRGCGKNALLEEREKVEK